MKIPKNNPDIKAVTSKSYIKQMESNKMLSSDPKKQQKSITKTVS